MKIIKSTIEDQNFDTQMIPYFIILDIITSFVPFCYTLVPFNVCYLSLFHKYLNLLHWKKSKTILRKPSCHPIPELNISQIDGRRINYSVAPLIEQWPALVLCLSSGSVALVSMGFSCVYQTCFISR